MPAQRSSRHNGFTLPEILCVLAIIGIITGIVLVNARTLVPSLTGESLEEQFETALRTARREALETRTTLRLKFDEDKQSFVITPLGMEEQPAPSPGFQRTRPQFSVRFTRPAADSRRFLIGGQARSLEQETAVLFFPDGTCTPFTAELRDGDTLTEITIDPWTTARVVQQRP